MLEHEKKALLTKNEYSLLLKRYKNASVSTQVNYYFDTDDLSMHKKGITCRIREKKGKFKTTVKKHGYQAADCSAEQDIIEKSQFDPAPFHALGLRLQGKLVTERTLAYKDPFCEMVLDRNTYLGGTDYEIEIEYQADYEKEAVSLLKSVAKLLTNEGLIDKEEDFSNRTTQSTSKSHRFFVKKCKGVCICNPF